MKTHCYLWICSTGENKGSCMSGVNTGGVGRQRAVHE